MTRPNDEPRPEAASAPHLLDTAAAARLLGLSPKTLEAYRLRGSGPAYYKAGRVRYRREDLLAWLEAHRRPRGSDEEEAPEPGGSRR